MGKHHQITPVYVIEVRNQDTAKANTLLKKLINEHKIASEHLKKISDNTFQKGLIDAQSILKKDHLHKTLNISLFILFFITLLTAGLILTSKIISRLKTTSSTLQVSDQKLSVVADELKNTGNQVVEFGSLNSAALTQISSSINEINSMSKLNTSNLNEANLFALNAAIEAARAGDHGK